MRHSSSHSACSMEGNRNKEGENRKRRRSIKNHREVYQLRKPLLQEKRTPLLSADFLCNSVWDKSKGRTRKRRKRLFGCRFPSRQEHKHLEAKLPLTEYTQSSFRDHVLEPMAEIVAYQQTECLHELYLKFSHHFLLDCCRTQVHSTSRNFRPAWFSKLLQFSYRGSSQHSFSSPHLSVSSGNQYQKDRHSSS